MKNFYFIYLLLLSFFPLGSEAQNIIEVEPLFEYPTAPDDLESITERCNYIVKHFWDNFDFKQKQALDQHALNATFQVYATTFQFAEKKEVDDSVDKLLNKLNGSPLLLLQIMKAAEENLYGPRATFWSDEIYLKFLDALAKNKKVPEARKSKYNSQAQTIRTSTVDNVAPSFEFIDLNGERKNYFPMSTPTLIIIGNPDDTDWRLSRLRMDSDFKLEEALKKGKVNILFIVKNESDNWQDDLSNYNRYWTLGLAPDITTMYDTRLNPSVYLIGQDGKITKKFISPEQGVEAILQLVN